MAKLKKEKTGQPFSWEQAIHELEYNGKKIRRKSWPENQFLFIESEGLKIYVFQYTSDQKIKYNFPAKDLKATDWECEEMPAAEPTIREHVLLSEKAKDFNAKRFEEFSKEINEAKNHDRIRTIWLMEKFPVYDAYQMDKFPHQQSERKIDPATLGALYLWDRPKDYYEQGFLFHFKELDPFVDEIEDIRTIQYLSDGKTRTASENPTFVCGKFLTAIIEGYADAMFREYLVNFKGGPQTIAENKPCNNDNGLVEGGRQILIKGFDYRLLHRRQILLLHQYIGDAGGTKMTKNNVVHLAIAGGRSTTDFQNTFNEFNSQENRIDWVPGSRRSANSTFKLFEIILPTLEKINPEAYRIATADFKRAKEKYKAEFERDYTPKH